MRFYLMIIILYSKKKFLFHNMYPTFYYIIYFIVSIRVYVVMLALRRKKL